MRRHYAEINVTPLIDVLLVLLIIFLAALLLTQKGLDAALPQPAPPQAPTVTPPTSIVLQIKADGGMAVNNQLVTMSELHDRLAAIFRERTDKTLFVMGDGTLPYGRVIEAIDIAKGAGVEKVGIVTESMRRAAR